MKKFNEAALTAVVFSAALIPRSWRPRYLQLVVTAFWWFQGCECAVVLGHYARCKMMAANGGAELGVKE